MNKTLSKIGQKAKTAARMAEFLVADMATGGNLGAAQDRKVGVGIKGGMDVHELRQHIKNVFPKYNNPDDRGTGQASKKEMTKMAQKKKPVKNAKTKNPADWADPSKGLRTDRLK